MSFPTPIVISKKTQQSNSVLKLTSLAASFGVHTALFASIAYFVTTHPIPLAPSEKRIVISLAEFTSTSGDKERLESSISHKKTTPPRSIEPTKSQPEPTAQKPLTATTPQTTPMKQPSVSSEASAPLAQPPVPTSTPPLSNTHIDSPHMTQTPSEKELPRNADNQPGGAALGHIRAMIENAITYPSIARKLRLEGVVLVTFVLKSDGTVDTAQIKNTSGSRVLDDKAIQTILSLSGDYPPLGKTVELSIPIAFNLHKS
jgi:periplasmic protein TonB